MARLIIKDNWYGLFINGKLWCVKAFNYTPTVLEFKPFYCSDWDYEVRELDIRIL